MKHWKIYPNYIFLFILLLCHEYSKCTDVCTNCQNTDGLSCTNSGTDECPQNCKPQYVGGSSSSCHVCSPDVVYYSIDSGNCAACIGNYIIERTKECTSSEFSNLYKLGAFYYSEDPSQNNNAIICTGKNCNCVKFFYQEDVINGIKKHKCYNTLDAAAADGYFYYNYDSNELFQSGCPGTNSRQKRSTSSSIIRCSDECYGTEWLMQASVSGLSVDYCVDDCGGKFKYIDNGVRKCLSTCPGGTYQKGTDCVTLEQCDFYLGTICYSICPSGTPYHNYGQKECITDCVTSSDYKYKKNTDDKTCYRKEDCNFIKEDTTNSNYLCLDSCGEGEFHDYNSKLLTTRCGTGGSTKLYFANDGNVCYDSCTEIKGGEYIYEEIDTTNGNYKCYKTKSCSIYYKKINGIRICSTMPDCISNYNSNYLLNGECKDSCDGYYQTEVHITGDTPLDYFKCYSSLVAALTDTDVTASFCDTSQKKCWTTFPNDGTYYIKGVFSSYSNKYEIIRDCENFYYQIDDDDDNNNNGLFKCVSACKDENLFFLRGNKKCESLCSDFNKYYFDDSNNECFDSCESLINKPFSYPLNIPSGSSIPNPEKCRSSCDDSSKGEYYNFNSHVCLSNCQANGNIFIYHKNSGVSDSTNSKVCYPSCLDIPGGAYKYELTDNTCSDDPSLGCNYYYNKGNGILKCGTTLQICKDSNNLYLIGNECTNKCDESYYKIVYEINLGTVDDPQNVEFTKCFPTPSGCLSVVEEGKSIYYNENLKRCWDDTSEIHNINNYFLKSIDSNLYELVNECEFYYYKNDDEDEHHGDNLNYCITECKTSNPSQYKFFIRGNKKCLNKGECYNLHKYYYDPDNNECIDTCKGRSSKKFQKVLSGSDANECLGECPSDTANNNNFPYHNYDSNICLEYCGADGSNNKYHSKTVPSNDEDKICYPSCSSIPGGNYNYQKEEDTDHNVYSCYSSSSDASCAFYYYENDGSKKCTDAPGCYAKNYIYLIGTSESECRDRCDEFYKYDRQISYTVDGDTETHSLLFKQCFLTKDDCYDFKNPGGDTHNPIYYNEKLKKCWDSYQNDYYYIKLKSQTSDYKYELIEKCDKYFYTQSTEKICVPECKDIIPSSLSMYFISNNQECLTKAGCYELHKYYYDDTNNECLDNCQIVNKYQDELSTSSEAKRCLPDCTSTSKKYNNYDSNICLSKCGADGSNKKYHKYNENICYPSCSDIPNGPFIYEIADTVNDDVYICYNDDLLASDESANCNYYYLKSDGTKKCTDASGCKAKNYIYLIKVGSLIECKDRCDEYYKYETLIDSIIFFECYISEDNCPENSSPPKNYFNKNLKKCWLDYQNGFFIKDRLQTQNIELVEECQHYYFQGTGTATVAGIGDSDKFYCTDKCKTNDLSFFYLTGKKNCATDCSAFSKHYYNPNSKECLDTCKGLPGLEFANQIVSPTTQEPCISQCTSPPYYDYGSFICIANCGLNDINKKYTKNANDGTEKVCYSSCAEIPGGSYIYEKGNVCYDSPPANDEDCAYYYIKANGGKQCASKLNCITKNYKYFIEDSSRQGFECRENCDGYYKMEVTEEININNDNDGNNDNVQITKCYDSKEKVLADNTNVKYYNIKSKLCWKEYPTGYYIIPNSGSASTPYEVVEECEYFYYKVADTPSDAGGSATGTTTYKYYCIDNCNESGEPYFVKGQKNCENSCTIFKKHYYHPTTNECLDTCKGLPNLEFAIQIKSDASNSPQKCRLKCDETDNPNNKYYDYNSNICISKCGDDNPNNLYHTNIGSNNPQDYICYPSCKDIPGNDYKYFIEGSDNIKICSSSRPSDGSCDFYYMKKDGTLECLGNSDLACANKEYKYLLGKECRAECDDYFKLVDDITSNGLIKCFKTKDDCLSTGEGGGAAIFFNIKFKKCWKKYPKDYFMKEATSNEIVEECENFYYKNPVPKANPDEGIDYIKYICIDNCKTTPLDLFYVTSKKNCENSCTVFGKYYYDPDNNQCLDTCIGRDNLEFADYIDFSQASVSHTKCKYECLDTQHYDYGTKICLSGSSCESTKFTKYGESENICYGSCLEIPGKKNIYESATGNICYTKNDIDSANPADPNHPDCSFYYQQNDGTIKCIPHTTSCYNEHFEYELGNECRTNCDGYYIYMDEGSNKAKKCFRTISEALVNNDIIFYDMKLKKCWKTYTNHLFIINEDNQNYHNTKYEVVENCDNFYVVKEINTVEMNFCKNNCQNEGKYFVSGNQICKSSCTEFNKNYYNPTNNECIDACSMLPDYKYQNPVNSAPQACKINCSNNYVTKTDGQDNAIYECVETCPVPSTSFNFLDVKTKECLASCSNDHQYEVDGKCYPKCDSYINQDTFECINFCPSYLPKKEVLITLNQGLDNEKNIYLCKTACDTVEFRLDEKCLEKCPQDFNYIGNNKICRENCNADANGQHYYPFNPGNSGDSDYYPIYSCINSCEDTPSGSYTFYTEVNPNECLSQCPDGSNGSPFIPFYLSSDPHKCLLKCPDNYPFYEGNDRDYECSDTNHCLNNNKYFLDGNCVTRQDCYNAQKSFISSKGICLPQCPEEEKRKRKNLDDDGNHDGTYTCLSTCGTIYEINSLTDPECVDICPDGNNFIGKDNKCKTSCEAEDGTFYYEKQINPYKLFQCVDGCKPENQGYQYTRVDDDGKQCYKECPTNFEYLSVEENRCYDSCLKSRSNTFSALYGTTPIKICSTQCDQTTNYKYYGENKVCIEHCDTLADTSITNYDNKCVAKCDLNSEYPYQLGNKCVKKCYDTGDTYTTNFIPISKRFSVVDYKCKPKCGDNEYLVEENKCVTQCNSFYNDVVGSDGSTLTGEKECIPSCKSIGKFYYPIDNICLTQCNTNDKVVEDTNICISDCNELTDKTYFFYEKTGIAPDLYDKCVLTCPNKKQYIYNGVCVEICPEEKRYFQSEFTHGETERHKICLTDCPVGYPYYTKTIISTSPEKIEYACKAICDTYYVPNDADSLIRAKLCLSSCPEGDFTYKIDTEINDKKCYQTCPVEAKYHFTLSSPPIPTDDNNCYKECPQRAPYHKIGETICLEESQITGGYLLYDKKEWVPTGLTKCPVEYTLYTLIEGLSPIVTVCLKECNFEHYASPNYIIYEYLTPYDTCVETCTSTTNTLVNDKFLENDELNKKCVCKNLYYISESTFKMMCYDPSITTCEGTSSPHNPYPLIGSKQCLKTCDDNRILNPSEDKCFPANTPCSNIDSNSHLITTSTGQKKCDCAYSFYIDTNNKKHCLGEGDFCYSDSGDYNLYIPELKQCVSSCPPEYPKKFKNFCVTNCPSGTVLDSSGSTCECKTGANADKFWYQTSETNFVCLEGNCPDNFPVYVQSTKQCLTTCKGSHYPNLFEKKCYHECPTTEIPNIVQMGITSSLAEYKCDCERPWYYDSSNDNKMHCPALSDNINKCEDYQNGLNYMIEETRQCLRECPSNYPYYFNNKCYISCEYANEKNALTLNIESKESSYECVCQNLWYIDPRDSYEKDKICYEKDLNECPPTSETSPSTRYLIYNTKQCVDSREECPTNSYKFNFVCYNKCPEFTLEEKEEITLSDSTTRQDNICVCNLDGYLYLEYEKYGNTYYKCGLDSCPETFISNEQEETRKNLLENEKKCVKSCRDDGKQTAENPNIYIYSFRNICVKECPVKTWEDPDEYNECKFYDLNDEDKIDDINKLKDAANIQAKELYEKSGSSSGYLLNKFDSSLQIYALKQFNNNKDLIMKSNLTYIDLGTCLNTIYKDYNLEPDDKILVTKYDLLTRNHKSNNENEGDGDGDGNGDNDGGGDNDGDEDGDNGGDGDNDGGGDNNGGNTAQKPTDDRYLINQVEYEFYLERTMEKIEGSICSPYEIEISYPIGFNKNRFNSFSGGINDNNYLKQFQIGKELHQKDPEIDTFNKDNKVYKDVCVGVELNGKDLVLEERYDYLYPNNVSLCESNCTMKNTDFELERINCMCTYKEIFDFNRIDEDTNDILNDPNFHKTTQSSANAEIIKCLSKIDIEEGIVKNEAFYFSAVVSLVEISMAVVSAVHGIKAVSGFMKGMLGINQANQAIKFNPGVTSANRILNNPPKRGEESNNEINEENNKGNIVIKKNIKMNYNPNSNPDNEIDEISINNNNNETNNINYGLSIKSGFPKNKKKINIEEEISSKGKVTSKYNIINIYSNKKAEFIPPQYNFKFFKPSDKGVVKRIERSKLPFDIDKNTKILLEGKKDIIYGDNYLEGPFYEGQNIIEIIDDNNIDNETKNIKYNENSNIYNNSNNNIMIKKITKNNRNDISSKEEMPNTKKRGISNNQINSEEKNFIKIKKINPITNVITVEDYKEEEEVKNVDSTTSIYNLMKREHTYLRVPYERYIAKRHPNILATFLAEILDKIYFIKIFIFLKKFEIFSIHLSLYMFYHILLLSLLCGFFTIKTIKKIWEDSNYPNMNFYLLYGFLANIIIWIIYRIFILLLDNQDKIRALVKLYNDSMNQISPREKMEENRELKDNENYNNKEIDNNKQDMINEKYEDLVKKIKIQTAIFYIIILLLTGFCFIYLVSFFAIYTGTKGKVFKAYYISIIEIILIKFVYGLCLGSLRIAGEGNELKSLYNFVYYCDKYLS